jgi:hypothetical protein
LSIIQSKTKQKTKRKNIMKTTEQNRKEVLSYLERSQKNFFQSENGEHWQAIVKIQKTGEYVFVKDGLAYPINLDNYTKEGVTAGKTFLKQKYHPTFNYSSGSSWYKEYGHSADLKLSAVRWNLARLELTANAVRGIIENC